MSFQDQTWLNISFITNILMKDLNDTKTNPVIDKFDCELASKIGENYSSILYRLKIFYHFDNTDIQEKSYIVKCMHPPSYEFGKMLKSIGIFEKESTMYNETLKEIQKLLESKGMASQLAPKFICLTTDPMEILVIEDLATYGFKVANKQIGLDFEHGKMVMSKLGNIHGTSMYLNRLNPKFRQHYNTGSYNPNTPDLLIAFFNNSINQAIGVMRQRPKCHKYVNKYESFMKTFMENGSELLKSIPEDYYGFNVLNHGDLWLTNIMFKYDENNKPIDVKFIDFQMSYFGTCAVDINYFFFSSLSRDVKFEDKKCLISIYHSALVETLDKFQYDLEIPTLENVYQELLKFKNVALMSTCMVLPLVKLKIDDGSKVTTEDIMNQDSNNDPIMSLYTNALYHEALEAALVELENFGYL